MVDYDGEDKSTNTTIDKNKQLQTIINNINMARYTGPKRKLERRENATLFGSENWKKRAYAPGQHGQSRRSRPSGYSIQFREKQKVKRTYGLTREAV